MCLTRSMCRSLHRRHQTVGQTPLALASHATSRSLVAVTADPATGLQNVRLFDWQLQPRWGMQLGEGRHVTAVRCGTLRMGTSNKTPAEECVSAVTTAWVVVCCEPHNVRSGRACAGMCLCRRTPSHRRCLQPASTVQATALTQRQRSGRWLHPLPMRLHASPAR